ncbi:MAG: hypothetical protein WBB07_17600 [Mycobacterium sp.]
MSYQVVAPLVIAKDQGGRPHHVYEGGVVQWLSDEQASHFLNTGLVVKFGADAADVDDEAAAAGGKPAEDATNKELIAWIVANVEKEDGSDYTADELGPPLKKADLRAIVDSVE